MDYTERLRRLTINDDRLEADLAEPVSLDARTLALARIAALVAVGGAEPSFGAATDAAISAGAAPSEIVDVLGGIASEVGVPRVVAAAPRLALALGCDLGPVDGGF